MEPIPAFFATTILLLLFPLIESRPPLTEHCLLWYGHGCAAITERDLCLSTRDGRPWRSWNKQLISGEPCVWCGGKACRNDSSKLCLPYDWVKDEIRKETIRNNGTKSQFTVANCQDSGPPLKALETPKVPRTVTFDRMHTLGQPHVGQACRANHILDDGRNAEYYWIFSAVSLKQCQAFCASKHYCRGIEYKKSDNYCELWWHPIQWTQAKAGYECYRISTRKDHSGSNRDCLSYTARGLPGACSWITDEKICLSSRDGRDRITELGSMGLKIHDEPCVWCGGRQCTTATVNKCEPYDWLMRGETRGLFKFLAEDNYTVATCSEPHPGSKYVSITSTTLPVTESISNGTVASDDGGFSVWGYLCGLLLLIALCAGLAVLLMIVLRGKGKGHLSRSATDSEASKNSDSDDEQTRLLSDPAPEPTQRSLELPNLPLLSNHVQPAQPLVPMPSLQAVPQQVWSPPAVQFVRTVVKPEPVVRPETVVAPIQLDRTVRTALPIEPTQVYNIMNQPDVVDSNRDVFDMLDSNRDGVIDRQEFSQAHAKGQVAFAPPGI